MKEYLNKWVKLAFIGFVFGWLFLLITNYMKPKSYEECVLKNIPKAQNDKAAALIYGACKRQFPEKYYSLEEASAPKR